MLWVFIIIGGLTSGSVVCRAALAFKAGRARWLLEALVLLPVAVAWQVQHTTALGWIALLVAFGIESLCWITGLFVAAPKSTRLSPPPGRPSKNALPRRARASAARSASNATPTASPGAVRSSESSDAPRIAFTTVALLGAVRGIAPEVFHASLRRVGQRDAELPDPAGSGQIGGTTGSTPGRVAVRAGPMLLELTAIPSPLPSAEVQNAAAQTWDWPEAAQVAAPHVAQIVITSRSPVRMDRVEIVRLHHRAHAALAEFDPIVAVLWRGPGRLAPTNALAELAGRAGAEAFGTAEAMACCVNFRCFPIGQTESGEARFVSDTVGLHVFSLPDLQVVSDGRPDESVSAAIYELAHRFFAGGCDVRDGQTWTCSRGDQWQAAYRTALSQPTRNVVQLERAAAKV